jgi:hypothetical protein
MVIWFRITTGIAKSNESSIVMLTGSSIASLSESEKMTAIGIPSVIATAIARRMLIENQIRIVIAIENETWNPIASSISTAISIAIGNQNEIVISNAISTGIGTVSGSSISIAKESVIEIAIETAIGTAMGQ